MEVRVKGLNPEMVRRMEGAIAKYKNLDILLKNAQEASIALENGRAKKDSKLGLVSVSDYGTAVSMDNEMRVDIIKAFEGRIERLKKELSEVEV